MAPAGLGSAEGFLRLAAKSYFNGLYANPPMIEAGEIDPGLNWTPSLHFKINDHLTVIVEVSETPYPMIFNLRRVDIENLELPIAIYCVCPEEAYLLEQPEAKRLMAHGYGLLTVSADGEVHKRCGCIPIVQQITESMFKAEVRPLPSSLRRRLAESYERYQSNAPSGVSDVTEVMEGLVLKAGREATRKAWIAARDARAGHPAATLAAILATPQCAGAAAAIGGVQSYISEYRNLAHHFPKNRKAAYKKYRDCRHAFIDGLKRVVFFRTAMKNIGLSGNL